jgi:hypothetical protein
MNAQGQWRTWWRAADNKRVHGAVGYFLYAFVGSGPEFNRTVIFDVIRF